MAKKREDNPVRVTLLLSQDTLDKIADLQRAAWESEGDNEPPSRGRMLERLVEAAHGKLKKPRPK